MFNIMRTRKGIKYKTRNKRGKGNTRKGKHNGINRRKRTFKKIKGGGWFSWNQKVKSKPGPIDILGTGASNAAETLARTTSKSMKLVTETAERSVEIAGASVNLGLNITHGAVDTTNLAFLTVNTVLQRCLNFVKRRFDESYTQISQCENRKYSTDGECVASCIIPIMTKFKRSFDRRRPSEYANLIKSINNTRALIDKSIDYFCKRGFIFGRICSNDIRRQKTEAKLVYSTLMGEVTKVKEQEDTYASNQFEAINSAGSCSTIIPLCYEYIDKLCTPFQKIQGINDHMKKQEDLLLVWNKKIEDAKQKAEFDSFLKKLGTTTDKANKERDILNKKLEQKKAQDEKIEKVVGLLKKNSEIEMYEREIFFIEQKADIESLIVISEQIVMATIAKITLLKEQIVKFGNSQEVITEKTQTEINLKAEEAKLKIENEKLEELKEKLKRNETKIKEILYRENNILGHDKEIGIPGLIDRLKENIDVKQREEEAAEAAAAAAAAAAETPLKVPNVLTGLEATEEGKVIAAEAAEAEAEAEQQAKLAEEKGAEEEENLRKLAAAEPLNETKMKNEIEKAANSATKL